MTSEARLMSGITLITVPTIQYGGYFLLTSLTNRSTGYMDNALRQNFFRAGHAHGGVIVLLWLICSLLRDSHFGGSLRFNAFAGRYRAERGRCSDLYRSNHPGNRRFDARRRSIAS